MCCCAGSSSAVRSTFSAPSGPTRVCAGGGSASPRAAGRTRRSARSSSWRASSPCCSIIFGRPRNPMSRSGRSLRRQHRPAPHTPLSLVPDIRLATSPDRLTNRRHARSSIESPRPKLSPVSSFRPLAREGQGRVSDWSSSTSRTPMCTGPRIACPVRVRMEGSRTNSRCAPRTRPPRRLWLNDFLMEGRQLS